MPAKAKTILIWIVVIFLIFAIVNSPDRASAVVEAIWNFIVDAISAFGTFFSNLTS